MCQVLHLKLTAPLLDYYLSGGGDWGPIWSGGALKFALVEWSSFLNSKVYSLRLNWLKSHDWCQKGTSFSSPLFHKTGATCNTQGLKVLFSDHHDKMKPEKVPSMLLPASCLKSMLLATALPG